MFKFRDTCIKEVVIIIGISEKVISNNRIIYLKDFIPQCVVLPCDIKGNFPPLVLYWLTDSFVVKIYLIFNRN